jgi:hypothetical protein
MKDRRGPGIMTVSTAGEDASGAAPSIPEAGDEVAAWISLPGKAEEHIHRHKEPAIKMADERRRDFIIGHLLRTFELRGPPTNRGETTRVLRRDVFGRGHHEAANPARLLLATLKYLQILTFAGRFQSFLIKKT